MLEPKTPPPTRASERDAYEIATRRDDGVCVKCRRGGHIHRDHRKNRSQGGLTTPANLQLLCLWDHKYLTENPHDAMREGWAVPGYARPENWPARRWQETEHGMLRLAWCLYDDAGGVHWITAEEAERRMNGTVA